MKFYLELFRWDRNCTIQNTTIPLEITHVPERIDDTNLINTSSFILFQIDPFDPHHDLPIIFIVLKVASKRRGCCIHAQCERKRSRRPWIGTNRVARTNRRAPAERTERDWTANREAVWRLWLPIVRLIRYSIICARAGGGPRPFRWDELSNSAPTANHLRDLTENGQSCPRIPRKCAPRSFPLRFARFAGQMSSA